MAGVAGQPPEPPDVVPRAAPEVVRGWARFRRASADAALALSAWLLVLAGSVLLGALAGLVLRFCSARLQAPGPGTHPGFWRGTVALVLALGLPLLATLSLAVLVASACVVALCLLLLLLPAIGVASPIYFATRLIASPAASLYAAAAALAVAALVVFLRVFRGQTRRPTSDYGIPGFLFWYFLACAALAALVPYERWAELARTLAQTLTALR